MNVVAFDLGTTVGWASRVEGDGSFMCGSKNLKHAGDGAGMRFLRFKKLLSEVLGPDVQLVVYEDVTFGKGHESKVLHGMRGILLSYCEAHTIPYAGIPVSSLKKWFSGKGNAKKALMREAMLKKIERGEVTVVPIPDDNNEVDAVALLTYSVEHHVPEGE